jgi:rhamnose utilization protein RhaD (predicted bifunctional aldolase and dehydrogenase)
MIDSSDALRASIVGYCAAIGSDPLLVQGAGGNVSWKDGDTLWIKASGTWLAQAAEKDIFVPVDLAMLRDAIAGDDFAVTPTVCGDSILRPSIETLLHALMPQRVVLHLHAVEVLAYLVRASWQDDFAALLDRAVEWTAVPYKKPGADLAAAVSLVLCDKVDAKVVFLESHGVVIGGNNIDEIGAILTALIEALRTVPEEGVLPTLPAAFGTNSGEWYVPVADLALHRLATDAALYARLSSQWALYPDHVVFLGGEAQTYADTETFQNLRGSKNLPELIFIQDVGVFTRHNFSIAKQLQLRCYYDVLIRQQRGRMVNTLLPQQINDLLNWDAEQYRMKLVEIK